MIPMRGLIWGYCIAHIMPPAAAAAEPIAKVTAMILLTLTPISMVVSMSLAMERIARPVLVRWMVKRIAPSRTRVSRGVQINRSVNIMPPTSRISLKKSGRGKALGWPPKITIPRFSRKKETPIAVIRAEIRGALRTGRYAPLSMSDAEQCCQGNRDDERRPPGKRENQDPVKSEIAAHHHDVAVGEVDEADHPVYHCIAEGYKSVKAPQ